jgi:hypothetical protein
MSSLAKQMLHNVNTSTAEGKNVQSLDDFDDFITPSPSRLGHGGPEVTHWTRQNIPSPDPVLGFDSTNFRGLQRGGERARLGSSRYV